MSTDPEADPLADHDAMFGDPDAVLDISVVADEGKDENLLVE